MPTTCPFRIYGRNVEWLWQSHSQRQWSYPLSALRPRWGALSPHTRATKLPLVLPRADNLNRHLLLPEKCFRTSKSVNPGSNQIMQNRIPWFQIWRISSNGKQVIRLCGFGRPIKRHMLRTWPSEAKICSPSCAYNRKGYHIHSWNRMMTLCRFRPMTGCGGTALRPRQR